MQNRAIGMVTAAVAAGLAGTAAGQSSLRGIGDIAGGGFHSEANGVSSDGRRVVGWSESATNQIKAITWTGGVISVVGDLSGGTVHGMGYATADNGVVVGQGTVASGAQGFKYRNGRFRALPPATAGTYGCITRAVASSGQVCVGSYEKPAGAIVAVLWVAHDPTELGYLDQGGTFSAAYGISDDASFVAGVTDSLSGRQAFRWDGVSGMLGLGDLPGGAFHSEAYAISRDGLVIVGMGTTATGTIAFRWTLAGGMEPLGDLPGGAELSVATATNVDGSVIVGYSSSAAGEEPFIWDRAHGMRSLKALLAASGANVQGWSLGRATGVSADGGVVVGTGTNPSGQTEGWIAKPQEPCAGDFNADGFVDFGDFDAFVACFEGVQCPQGKSADFDGDGFADFLDVEAFVAVFEAGC